MFSEHKFESLEINPSKKIFKINGEDFGKYCYEYDISVCQRENEIIVNFHRYGRTDFTCRYDARTGKIKKPVHRNWADFKMIIILIWI